MVIDELLDAASHDVERRDDTAALIIAIDR
jgi:hypothetical protein